MRKRFRPYDKQGGYLKRIKTIPLVIFLKPFYFFQEVQCQAGSTIIIHWALKRFPGDYGFLLVSFRYSLGSLLQLRQVSQKGLYQLKEIEETVPQRHIFEIIQASYREYKRQRSYKVSELQFLLSGILTSKGIHVLTNLYIILLKSFPLSLQILNPFTCQRSIIWIAVRVFSYLITWIITTGTRTKLTLGICVSGRLRTISL